MPQAWGLRISQETHTSVQPRTPIPMVSSILRSPGFGTTSSTMEARQLHTNIYIVIMIIMVILVIPFISLLLLLIIVTIHILLSLYLLLLL